MYKEKRDTALKNHKEIKMIARYSHLAPTALNSGIALLESHAGNNVVDFDKRRILEE